MTKIEGLCDLVLVIKNKNLTLTWNDIDTVLLAGGMTRMPMVQDLLKRISGKELRTDLINPDECVALGAALQSKIIDIKQGKHSVSQEVIDKLGSITVKDIATHTLGVVTLIRDSDKKTVVPMIKKGSEVPCTEKQLFETSYEGQSAVEIEIKEGESKDPENTTTIKKATLPIRPPLPKGSPIEITYSLNEGATLSVIGKDVTNNKSIEVIVDLKFNLTPDEVEKGKSNIKSIEVKG